VNHYRKHKMREIRCAIRTAQLSEEAIKEKKLDGKADMRGYDGSQGDRVIPVLDAAKGSPRFRWTEDLARTWRPAVPVTG
jgi:hypothetical protein